MVVCLSGSIHGPWTQLLGIKSLKLARIGWLAGCKRVFARFVGWSVDGGITVGGLTAIHRSVASCLVWCGWVAQLNILYSVVGKR